MSHIGISAGIAWGAVLSKAIVMTRQEIIDFIQHQIDWRGPGGNKQGHVVIARKEAEVLLELLKDVESVERQGQS